MCFYSLCSNSQSVIVAIISHSAPLCYLLSVIPFFFCETVAVCIFSNVVVPVTLQAASFQGYLFNLSV